MSKVSATDNLNKAILNRVTKALKNHEQLHASLSALNLYLADELPKAKENLQNALEQEHKEQDILKQAKSLVNGYEKLVGEYEKTIEDHNQRPSYNTVFTTHKRSTGKVELIESLTRKAEKAKQAHKATRAHLEIITLAKEGMSSLEKTYTKFDTIAALEYMKEIAETRGGDVFFHEAYKGEYSEQNAHTLIQHLDNLNHEYTKQITRLQPEIIVNIAQEINANIEKTGFTRTARPFLDKFSSESLPNEFLVPFGKDLRDSVYDPKISVDLKKAFPDCEIENERLRIRFTGFFTPEEANLIETAALCAQTEPNINSGNLSDNFDSTARPNQNTVDVKMYTEEKSTDPKATDRIQCVFVIENKYNQSMGSSNMAAVVKNLNDTRAKIESDRKATIKEKLQAEERAAFNAELDKAIPDDQLLNTPTKKRSLVQRLREATALPAQLVNLGAGKVEPQKEGLDLEM